MDFGVMALGIVPAGGSFNGTGAIGTSFQAGGVGFAPGRSSTATQMESS